MTAFVLPIPTWVDHLISGLIFFREIIIRSEMATEWDTWQLCTSVCAKPEVGISPHSLWRGPWMNVYNSVRRISRCRRKCSSVCALISVSVWGKRAETYEMLHATFGESCLSRSKTFEWYSRFKSGRRSFETTPAQAGLPPPTPRRRGTCARNHSC